MCNALEELRREGVLEGQREGRLEGIRATIRICKKFSISEEDIIRNIVEEFSLSQEEASGYVKKYKLILKRMAPVNYALVKKDFGLSDRSLLLCSWRHTKEISPPKGELT